MTAARVFRSNGAVEAFEVRAHPLDLTGCAETDLVALADRIRLLRAWHALVGEEKSFGHLDPGTPLADLLGAVPADRLADGLSFARSLARLAAFATARALLDPLGGWLQRDLPDDLGELLGVLEEERLARLRADRPLEGEGGGTQGAAGAGRAAFQLGDLAGEAQAELGPAAQHAREFGAVEGDRSGVAGSCGHPSVLQSRVAAAFAIAPDEGEAATEGRQGPRVPAEAPPCP